MTPTLAGPAPFGLRQDADHRWSFVCGRCPRRIRGYDTQALAFGAGTRHAYRCTQEAAR